MAAKRSLNFSRPEEKSTTRLLPVNFTSKRLSRKRTMVVSLPIAGRESEGMNTLVSAFAARKKVRVDMMKMSSLFML